MKTASTIRKCRREEGIALLIAIFILLLIAVVAIALIVSSHTESALAGNYRYSTSVYYAAVAGLEEARARLRPNDPNAFRKTNPTNFLPLPGTALAACAPVYVLNPLPGEVVTPWDPANAYYDAQFNQEFNSSCPAPLPPNPSPKALSVWNRAPLNGLAFPGPLYKWVRINAVSENSLKLDVDADGLADSTTPLYYDNTNSRFSNNAGVGSQALELTALAVLPNGSQKLLQYLVASEPLNLNFPAALILDGNTPQFTASPAAGFYVKGIDQGSAGTCNPGPIPLTAVGYTDTSYTLSNFEKPSNSQGISVASPDLRGNYTNGVVTNPDIAAVTLSPNLSTVGGLNALVQTIKENADVVVNGNATQTGSGGPIPAAMSASNPITIVVNGDLTFSSWRNTGYGLLLVTGKLTYDPDTSWAGIILVIGQGWMYASQGSYTNTQIQGAVLIAKTVGLASTSVPVSSRFDFYSTPDALTNGIYYSSCWTQAAMPTIGYKILSFHEIAQ